MKKRILSLSMLAAMLLTMLIPLPGYAEETNRNQVRSQLAIGGWDIVYGDLINEADYLAFLAAVAAAVVAENPAPIYEFFDYQLQAQIEKIKRTAPEIAQDALVDLVLRAFDSNGGIIRHGRLEVSAGIATYRRWETVIYHEPRTYRCKQRLPFGGWTWSVCTTMEKVERTVSLPNNHQPYFRFRWTSPPETSPNTGSSSTGHPGTSTQPGGSQPPSSPPISGGTGIPSPVSRERIRFASGTTSHTFTAYLSHGMARGYVLGVSANQTIHVMSSRDVQLYVLDPAGRLLAAQTPGSRQAAYLAPTTGDYTLILQGEGEVMVTIEIPPLSSSTSAANAVCSATYTTRLQIGDRATVGYEPPLANLVRSQPHRDGAVVGRIVPGAGMQILDGPQCANGWIWWYVRSDAGVTGWTSEGDQNGYWLIPQ